jgi:antitoxin component of MazEF toxin-antitoxin module
MPGEASPFVSRAVRATRESTSLRVTIPQVVAATLGLRPGDDVVWIVDPISDQVRVEAVRRDPPVGEAAPAPPEEA